MSDQEYKGPVKVTVTLVETGEVIDEKIVNNDFLVICNGDRYIKSSQMWGQTIQLNIARVKREVSRG